ncbi:4-(cytidine 5'-diphospho)-2-C-methyl-D-erythritol kinase [Rhodopirellula sp. P2]|uniref:4-(cytidine 5'-diphospho)-2-C-methyl-D-erythritol kinase n=1 Tax=Rhodopirellula sp. P2 TaxID=2127060 RepID=UPI0023677F95|nr:4-(cytidine 5'-diphospho)-2-C-methyl-D-erythritol kinase [Rhodopirellula sp. P2]WDQ17413.1 4-(cytidine 5'-diphospho)-2-C-methyl-D-erythritol kinase [Rhodopirellula sp. P2]
MTESRWYHTSPPAKLNLFLELLARRDDGFHELDTVMIAIDWRDELRLRRTSQPGVRLSVDWIPDRAAVANELQVKEEDELLFIPTDDKNLVVRALNRLSEALCLDGGWEVQLNKNIPSGAGMGGASSDAASALQLGWEAASETHSKMPATSKRELLLPLAAEIGSDVPFFFGGPSFGGDPRANEGIQCARATGRGEKLEFFRLANPLHAVVIYPAASVSTAEVYSRCSVPDSPHSSDDLVLALQGMPAETTFSLHNTLEAPARGLSSRIDPALECLSKAGLTHCHMTGSGSACFALADSSQQAALAAETLRSTFPGGALIRPVMSCVVPSEIHIA